MKMQFTDMCEKCGSTNTSMEYIAKNSILYGQNYTTESQSDYFTTNTKIKVRFSRLTFITNTECILHKCIRCKFNFITDVLQSI